MSTSAEQEKPSLQAQRHFARWSIHGAVAMLFFIAGFVLSDMIGRAVPGAGSLVYFTSCLISGAVLAGAATVLAYRFIPTVSTRAWLLLPLALTVPGLFTMVAGLIYSEIEFGTPVVEPAPTPAAPAAARMNPVRGMRA